MLKPRIATLVHNSFKRRDGSNKYIHIEITGGKGYFTETINLGEDNLYTEDQICRMVEFPIDNINQTQYAEVSNCNTCTKLISEERWT